MIGLNVASETRPISAQPMTTPMHAGGSIRLT